MSARPKTALVLAGGGSYGVVQVGMLRALCAHGVQPGRSRVAGYCAAHWRQAPTAR
jgi:NTE family protein